MSKMADAILMAILMRILPRSSQGAQFCPSVGLCSPGTVVSIEYPVQRTYELLQMKIRAKTKISDFRSDYRLFMNVFSIM
jgi:hypothetical protein